MSTSNFKNHYCLNSNFLQLYLNLLYECHFSVLGVCVLSGIVEWLSHFNKLLYPAEQFLIILVKWQFCIGISTSFHVSMIDK